MSHITQVGSRLCRPSLGGLFAEAESLAIELKSTHPDDPRVGIAFARVARRQGTAHFLEEAAEHLTSLAKSNSTGQLSDEISSNLTGLKRLLSFSMRFDFESSHVKSNIHFLASGGLTHMLSCLGACIAYGTLIGRDVVPILEVDRSFSTNFSEFFETRISSPDASRFTSSVVVSGSQEIASGYLAQGAYTKPVKHSDGRVYYILSNDDTPFRYHFPAPIKGQTLEMTGFDNGNIWPLQDKLEDALSQIQVLPQMAERIRSRSANTQHIDIGVHFRNTDYKGDLKNTFTRIEEELSPTRATIYWATDDPDSLTEARRFFGDRALIINSAQMIAADAFGAPNIHSISDQDLKSAGYSKQEHVSDFLLDCFMLSRADRIIYSDRSSVRGLVKVLRRRDDLRNGLLRLMDSSPQIL